MPEVTVDSSSTQRAATTLIPSITTIQPLDLASMEDARAHQQQLTKPPGSLGRLETLHVQLAGIQRTPLPDVTSKAVIIMAADHGVTAEGVSAYPSEVTPQMVLNFVHGGAAINVLARQVGARVTVVDIGVAAPLPATLPIMHRRVRSGTRNMARGSALTLDETLQAINTGIDIVREEFDRGTRAVATGEMGIGNTTASSAIVAAITGKSVAEVTGRGTGIADVQLKHKIGVIQEALRVNAPDPADALDVLTKVGGLEIAGLTGVCLGAALCRIPVVIDGFIAGAAALVAAELCPTARQYMIPGHMSVEIGHRVILERLELAPLLTLDLRLGEGTGAALAFHLLEAACRIPAQMATFASAGVSGPA